jgi:pimeloyl-ACP methyl ester carboxylesterase
MSKKFLVTAFILLCYFSSGAQGHLISYTLFQTTTKEEFREAMKKRHLPKSIAPARYDVDVYDVTYYTQWHDGSTIKATGLYFAPRHVKKGSPELIYNHGTRMNKGRHKKLGGEESFCLAMAMDGYAVALPDYVGLGRGDKFHLYQVAASLGQASVDMLLAVREIDSVIGLKTSGQLFLSGYSEGGYAAMATNKLIQDKYPNIHVTASSPMSGAYDMTGVEGHAMFKKYGEPHYLPFLLGSYNEVYHIVPNVNMLYKHPYDSIIPPLSSEHPNIDDVIAQLPAVPGDILKDTFVNGYLHDPDFPLIKAIKANNLYDWKPANPVQLCYCDSDEQVTPLNAFVAYDQMKKDGAKHVTLREAGKDFKHTRCALVAMLYTKMYFDTFRHGRKYGGKGSLKNRIVADIARDLLAHQKKDGHHDGPHSHL